MLISTFFVISILLRGHTYASLIASSEVQSCRRTTSDFEPILSTGETCSKKFVVALAVRNGQGESNHIYANIRHVSNSTDNVKRNEQLKKPFRISVTKSDVQIHYPLRYLESVNNHPIEGWVNVHNPIVGIAACNDKPLSHNRGDQTRASCGYQFDGSGNVIPHSQGYCCEGDWQEKLSQRWKYRRGVGYKVWHSHVHWWSQGICMTHGPLWYHVFEIGEPFLTYQINITVQQYDTMVRVDTDQVRELWHTIGYATVGPERPGDNTANRQTGETSTPKIKVTWEGDFLPTSSINRLNHKYLMVPDWNSLAQARDNYDQDLVAMEEEQFTGGHQDWLVVDKHLFDFSGRTCNKLGVSYEGFKFQRNGCRQERQSCFRVTPRNLFMDGKLAQQNGMSSPYFPSFYGELLGPFHDLGGPTKMTEIDKNTTFRLAYKATHTQNSLVTLTFTAESVSFVENWSPGRITETFIQDFTALGGAGQLYVLVQNTGTVTSDYAVSIDDCSSGIIRVSDRSQTIDPLLYGEFIFEVSTSINEDMNHTCSVVLFDNRGTALHRKDVHFSTFRTCYCAGQCKCECNGREQTTDSIFCTEDKYQNPFWTPDIVIVEPCTYCWFTDALKSPFSCSVLVLVCLLSLGMFKMLCLHTCCRAKDGRPIDVVGIILGTVSEEHTRRKTRATTIHFLLGACFFVYLPLLPLLMVFCNWKRRRQAKKRLKKKLERKKQRIMEKKKKAVKAMKGLMVTRGLEEGGITLNEMMAVMDEGLEEKKKKKTKQQKLVVSSSSSDTSDQDFDYSTSSGEDMPIAVRRRQPKSKGGGDGGLMADIQSQATKQMAREAVKMGMGMLF